MGKLHRLAAIHVVAVAIGLGLCNAGKIDSTDLLIGTWDAFIRCSDAKFGELFPQRCDRATPPRISSRRSTRAKSFACEFSLFPNGTFGLRPKMSVDDNSTVTVRGHWKVDVNPYCVTDRFYDDITLVSYPRVQKKWESNSPPTIVQKLRLQLKCRLSGHFTGNRLRFRDRHHFARGKLSHGLLVVQRDECNPVKHPWWRRPKIVATFSAKRLIPTMESLDSQSFHDDDIL
jgi:hypothetical protein